jgi:putative component of membrane protein insertase Oxa1/YidC/SpoIIIJ protein YidD
LAVCSQNFEAVQGAETLNKQWARGIKMKLWQRLIIAIFDVIRPFFGYMNCSCIYPVSCSDYAKHMVTERPGVKSVVLVGLRVLSCNPITAIFMRLRK